MNIFEGGLYRLLSLIVVGAIVAGARKRAHGSQGVAAHPLQGCADYSINVWFDDRGEQFSPALHLVKPA